MMIDCENQDNGVCLIATSLARQTVKTCEAACSACYKTSKPRSLNVVVCSIAYAASKNDALLDLWHECNNTYFNKPGSHLKRILKEIGIISSEECGCDGMVSIMNDWGTHGCLVHREEIIAHLNEQDVTWLDMARVVLAGYLTTGQLVDECIKRAKVLN